MGVRRSRWCCAGGFAEEPERVVVSAPEVSGSINQYFVLNSQVMFAYRTGSSPALVHVPCDLGGCCDHQVIRIAASAIAAQVLDLEAFRDGLYP
jgi:hypothetical protein